MKTAGAILATLLAMLAYTKLVWQSGFDQGADVTICVIASLENGGKLDPETPACVDADKYRRNPLWALRRRNGANL